MSMSCCRSLSAREVISLVDDEDGSETSFLSAVASSKSASNVTASGDSSSMQQQKKFSNDKSATSSAVNPESDYEFAIRLQRQFDAQRDQKQNSQRPSPSPSPSQPSHSPTRSNEMNDETAATPSSASSIPFPAPTLSRIPSTTKKMDASQRRRTFQQMMQQNPNQNQTQTQPSTESTSSSSGLATASASLSSSPPPSLPLPFTRPIVSPPATSPSPSAASLSTSASSTPSFPITSSHLAFFMNRVMTQENRFAVGLSDLLTGDVKRCILVNYEIDVEWMMEAFPVLQTYPRVDVVYHVTGARGIAKPNKLPLFPNTTHYSPPLPIQYGVHHSKILLSFYDNGCRLAIVTANFIKPDWCYKNNVSYVQDFPLKSDSAPKSSVFEEELMDYFNSYRRAELIVDELRLYDFAGATAIIIASVPGRHTGAKLYQYGHMKLRKELARETLEEKFLSTPIVAQFSSVGSIHEKWLMEEFRLSLAAHRAGKGPQKLPPLRLMWPTTEYVRQSLEGWNAGGSLCCDSKNQKPFMQPLLHIFDGKALGRHQASPHIKSYCRASKDGEVAWCLITSANMSNSAWGALQLSNTQLQIRSYEIGCLFTPTHYAKALAYLRDHQQTDFTCTPLQPIKYSTVAAAAVDTQYSGSGRTVPTTQDASDGNAAAASQMPASSSSSLTIPLSVSTSSSPPSASSSSLLPTVRFHLLPPLANLESLVTPQQDYKRVKFDDGSSSSSTVHVVCPLPYDVFARKYAELDEPWVWDKNQPLPDHRGIFFLPEDSK